MQRFGWSASALLFASAILSALPGPALADNWPRFRGPNGTGVSADKDIPLSWNEKEGILWKTRIPGQGNSAPIVWGNRLFLQTASDDGKHRSLVCLDVATGKVKWTRERPGAPNRKHAKNSLASSTPATDGERVYVLFWDGKEIEMAAFDLDGQPLWSRNLGIFNSTSEINRHGVGHSPIVYKNRVFLANDQTRASVLLGLDAATGEIRWQAPRRAFRCCYSTPFIHEVADKPPELIVASSAGITSYEPISGRLNWDHPWQFDAPPLRTVASPLYSQGLFFANSGDGGGSRHTIAIKVADGASAVVWEEKRSFPYVPTMLVHGDELYLVNDRGIASCHDARTGRQFWDHRLSGGFTASPVLIDGKVYAINEKGTAFVFAASPTFKQLGKSDLGEPVLASPAVADNRLYIRGSEHLFCIGRQAEKSAGGR